MIFALGLVLGTILGILVMIGIEILGAYVRYRRGNGKAWRAATMPGEPGPRAQARRGA